MISCKFEDGGSAHLRHVTVDVVVENEGKILLVKRAENLYLEPGKWTIPGGFLGRDESAESGAVREVLEESGCEVEITDLIRVNSDPDRPKEDRQNVDIVYAAKLVKQSDNHDHEVSEVAWFDKNSLPDKSEFAFDHRDNIDLYLASN